MPGQCQSCGEHAVIEAEIDGEGTKYICVECGTVDSAYISLVILHFTLINVVPSRLVLSTSIQNEDNKI